MFLPSATRGTFGRDGLVANLGRRSLSRQGGVILDKTCVRRWTLGADTWIVLHTPQAVRQLPKTRSSARRR
jgi:hypothetical protein